MVERAVDRAEESRTVALSLGVGELRAQRVQPLIHPAVVTCHHLAVFGTDHGNDCSRSSRVKKTGRWSAPRATEEKRRTSPALLHAFAVETYVEPFALLFLGDAQTDRPVDDFEDDEAADTAHHEC